MRRGVSAAGPRSDGRTWDAGSGILSNPTGALERAFLTGTIEQGVRVGIYLDQINIVVRDMEAMVDFYERLGLSVSDGGAPEWQPHHREARTEGADVDLDSQAFTSKWNRGWPGGAGTVLGFRVDSRDDVDRLYHELTAAGHEGQQEPYDAFWGARFAAVTDPDGNAVAIMSPAEEAFRSPPTPP